MNHEIKLWGAPMDCEVVELDGRWYVKATVFGPSGFTPRIVHFLSVAAYTTRELAIDAAYKIAEQRQRNVESSRRWSRSNRET